MKTVDGKCQFCGKALHLQIDDAYAGLGDPFHLVAMAACDHCADLRERRRSIEERVRRICLNLLQHPAARRSEPIADCKPGLRLLLQQWCGLCEDWNGGGVGEWDEAMLESVLASPEHYGDALGTVWRMSKKAAPQGALL